MKSGQVLISFVRSPSERGIRTIGKLVLVVTITWVSMEN
jgi:hypothetical protein